MVSTWSGLRRETPLAYSHPPLAAMTDTNIVQQLQNHVAEIERHHEKELTKLKGVALTCYGGLPPRPIDNFDTLIERFSAQYATIKSHRMSSTALANLRQVDDESLRKFMDGFGLTTVQIRNLNPEISLHSMLLILRLDKFVDNLFKKPLGRMDELRERAKSYIQIEEMTRFRNEVWQAGQKCDKRKAHTKGPKYEHYTPLMTNHTTILKEALNLKVPIWLLQTKPPRSGLDVTKYYRYHRGIGHNIEYCWALKDKIKEIIQAGYLTQFVKRPDNHQVGPRLGGHPKEQHRNHEADKRRAEDQGRQRHQQQRRGRQPPPEQEPA
ncbi:uncharacterized protein [Glycine max]|uniref:uncharacterized protein n=1 Tax=Glycine max TaxID=3847 RepID=UPI00023D6EFA|nr:uncharacterized protein LOC106796437 [Glycine max]|eukprot:XP_014624202.1 uncharacterized protein LOC106796437 [Glycine max]